MEDKKSIKSSLLKNDQSETEVSMSKPVSRVDHENLSTQYLISYYDHYRNEVISGKIDTHALAGPLAKIIEGLFYNFFFDNRGSVPLRSPHAAMTIVEILDLIQEALEIISRMRPNLLDREWDGRYYMKMKDEDKNNEC